MTKSTQVGSGSGSAAEVRAPKKRRVFTASEKLRIVREADACGPGEVGALLRREGIYSSHLSTWRKALGTHGTAGLAGVRRGRKPKYDAKDRRIQELERRLRAADKELAIRQALIELQKKSRSCSASRCRASRRSRDAGARRWPRGRPARAGLRSARHQPRDRASQAPPTKDC